MDGSLENTGDEPARIQVKGRKHNRSDDTIIFRCQQGLEERGMVRRAERSACAFELELNDKPETAREETPNCKSRRNEENARL